MLRFLTTLAAFTCVFVINKDALANEPRYVDKLCLESAPCRTLANEKPDYVLEGEVLEVIDGDTIFVRLHVLPGIIQKISLRARGIDAPEKRRSECEEERAFGELVAASIGKKFLPGTWIRVSDVEYDKYGGRYVAKIERRDSDRFKSLAEELLESNSTKWGNHPHGVTDPNYDWCRALKSDG